MKLIGWGVLSLLLLPVCCWAILGLGDTGIFHDPIAYVVHLKNQAELIKANTESARQTLAQVQMVAQQAEQIKNQVTGLSYALRNLRQNPMSVLDQVQALWNSYNQTLMQAQGLSYNLAQSSAQFDTLFPKAGVNLKRSVGEMAAHATQMLEQIRQAGRTATQSQAVIDRLCQQQVLSQQAVASAKAADGMVSVSQAQAQLMGVTNEQLAALIQLQATQGRMATSVAMAEAQANQNAIAQSEAWLKGWPTTGFRGRGQGQGPALPQ